MFDKTLFDQIIFDGEKTETESIEKSLGYSVIIETKI